ncbi:Mitotic spindle checkpoint component mad2 [Rhizophlyctis rosea]|uniref:Mitotic spindle checkpoint component mad2 n=1 Tax=Rhizophlyctis rosea TaxID=64517 RepID=A0AAD5SJJ0_9FUNG|nr:Mitotic spindle checkpoint component mad2 [Rhizophlyctis rosea]
MSTARNSKQITLRGSAEIVVEFFEYCLNSILFQRGLYPPEDFRPVKKYGLAMMVAINESLNAYLRQVLTQVGEWITANAITKLVMVISSKDTREVVERWQFNILLERDPRTEPAHHSSVPLEPKSEKVIQAEIAAIMRQITASASFLPLLDDPCTFNILAYTDKNAEVPATWAESDARLITRNAEQVKLRSFSTSVHRVEGLVAYRLGE